MKDDSKLDRFIFEIKNIQHNVTDELIDSLRRDHEIS